MEFSGSPRPKTLKIWNSSVRGGRKITWINNNSAVSCQKSLSCNWLVGRQVIGLSIRLALRWQWGADLRADGNHDAAAEHFLLQRPPFLFQTAALNSRALRKIAGELLTGEEAAPFPQVQFNKRLMTLISLFDRLRA
jgi:hypothetical protein